MSRDADEPEIIECPSCLGTGRNRHGGPCRRCRTTGQIEEYGFYIPSVAAWLTSPVLVATRALRRWRGVNPDTGLPHNPERGEDER